MSDPIPYPEPGDLQGEVRWHLAVAREEAERSAESRAAFDAEVARLREEDEAAEAEQDRLAAEVDHLLADPEEGSYPGPYAPEDHLITHDEAGIPLFESDDPEGEE